MLKIDKEEIGVWHKEKSYYWCWKRRFSTTGQGRFIKYKYKFIPSLEYALEQRGRKRDVSSYLLQHLEQQIHPDFWKYIKFKEVIERERSPGCSLKTKTIITRCYYRKSPKGKS